MNNVTAIIVSYNTADLLQKAVYSVRKYYPDMKIIIIDGSEPSNFCQNAVRELALQECINAKVLGYNIGHGKGLHMGLTLCETKYALLMDTDVTINCSGVIERLRELFTENTFGVGKVLNVDRAGNNVVLGHKYLHPHFALISKEKYFKVRPAINHGAPLLLSMFDLPSHGYKLIDVCWGDNVTHHERGTRKLNPKEFHPKNWDKI